jgi:hypothetical protein
MKTFAIILNVVLLMNSTAFAQSEVGNSQGGIQELLNRSNSKDKSDKSIRGGAFEYEQVPELLNTFFNDADCSYDQGTPFEMKMPFVPEENRIRGDVKSGALVCEMRYGAQTGGKQFTLCTHPSVTCKSIVGGLKKDNIVYTVPVGQRCDSISARKALLTSMQSNPGGFNVTKAN